MQQRQEVEQLLCQGWVLVQILGELHEKQWEVKFWCQQNTCLGTEERAQKRAGLTQKRHDAFQRSSTRTNVTVSYVTDSGRRVKPWGFLTLRQLVRLTALRSVAATICGFFALRGKGEFLKNDLLGCDAVHSGGRSHTFHLYLLTPCSHFE